MTVHKFVLIGGLAGAAIALVAYSVLGHGDTGNVHIAAPRASPHEAIPTTSPVEATLPDMDSAGLDQSDAAFEAENAARQGLTVAFTWYPETDATANDAFARARPWLTHSLAERMLVDARTEHGPSLQWGQWASKGTKVVADVSIGCSGCPPDSSTALRRVATIRQTAITADRTEAIDSDITVWVTLTKNVDQWLIDEIHY